MAVITGGNAGLGSTIFIVANASLSSYQKTGEAHETLHPFVP